MTEGPERRKRGSEMSDKEIARSVLDQRLVTFYPEGFSPVRGFVVGMDDYHWKVACPEYQERGLIPTHTTQVVLLVHKSCPLISFDGYALDTHPDEEIRQWVSGINSSFRAYCAREYFGQHIAMPNKEQQ